MPMQLRLIRSEIEATDGISRLLELLTMRLGPDSLIVAARVAFDDGISADQAEDLSDGIDARLADRLPVQAHVFLDPTQLKPGSAGSPLILALRLVNRLWPSAGPECWP